MWNGNLEETIKNYNKLRDGGFDSKTALKILEIAQLDCIGEQLSYLVDKEV